MILIRGKFFREKNIFSIQSQLKPWSATIPCSSIELIREENVLWVWGYSCLINIHVTHMM